MRVAPAVSLTEEQTTQLKAWARGRKTPTRLVRRAKIVLLAAEGKKNKEIGHVPPTSEPTLDELHSDPSAQYSLVSTISTIRDRGSVMTFPWTRAQTTRIAASNASA